MKNPNSNFSKLKSWKIHVTLVTPYLSNLVTTNYRWSLTSTDVCIPSLFHDGWSGTGMKMQRSPSLFQEGSSFWWNWRWKIINQFVNDDNTIALPAVCGKNMQRKYQEMRLTFSHPKGIYSCNFFYWSARFCRDLVFKIVKLWLVFVTMTVLIRTTFKSILFPLWQTLELAIWSKLLSTQNKANLFNKLWLVHIQTWI